MAGIVLLRTYTRSTIIMHNYYDADIVVQATDPGIVHRIRPSRKVYQLYHILIHAARIFSLKALSYISAEAQSHLQGLKLCGDDFLHFAHNMAC